MRSNRNLVWAAVGVAVFALGLVQHAAAGTNPARTTYLTFSQPVQLPGASLGAGTYIFELADPSAASGVVRVLSADRRIAVFMGFTHEVERPRWMNLEASVSLGESIAGVAPRITAWWPAGERSGRQFIYPSH
jgi:hypothetical protein